MAASIRLNYVYSVMYQVLNIIVPVFTIPYLSRIFGADGLGVYSYTTSISQCFLLLAMLGLNNYGVRAIAMIRDKKEELNRTFSEIWIMQLMTGLFALIIYCLFILFLADKYSILLLILALSVLSSLFDVNWYFLGKEEFKITVIRNSIIKIVTLIFIFTFIKDANDIWLYVFLHAISILISSLVLWPLILKEVKIVRPLFKNIVKHLKPNCVMFIPVVAISVYKYMDKVMLGANSMEQAGYYENVEKILTVVLGLVTAFGAVMLPRISNLMANNKDVEANHYLAKSMEFIMFLSVGMAAGFYIIAESFVPLYFGKGFESCIRIMQTLSITAIITSWANVIRTQHLIPTHKDNVYVVSVIVGAILNLIGNLIMIPKYGAMGAVYSTILAEFSVALVQTKGSDASLPYKIMVKDGLVYCLFGGIMILVSSIFKIRFKTDSFIGLLLLIILSGSVYLVLTLLYKKNKDGQFTYKI